MKNISIRYLFDKRNIASLTKQGLLQIEVRKIGTSEKALVSTGIKLYKNQFSKNNGFTCKNHNKAPAITKRARDVFNQVEAFALSEKCTDLSKVKNYKVPKPSTYSVVEFVKERLRKSNPTESVLKHHNVLINKIDQFGKFKTFSDLTYINLLDFDSYLRKTINSSTLLYKRHSTFRKYIQEAIKLDLCQKNPYDDFELKKGHDKERVFLTEEEIKKIQDYNAAGKLYHIKDLFILQCFTGLSYVDLMNLNRNSIEKMGEYKVIRSNRVKTDGSFITLLLPEAEDVLKRYNYRLPRISNQKYNDYLKLLAEVAGVRKNITSHVARHTFATYLLNKDVPIETVSRALGHTDISTTKIYAKMLGKKVVNDMAKLLGK